MRRTCRQDFRGLAVVFGLALLGFVPARAQSSGKVASGRFQLSADGMTVHDDVLHVTWLVDANLPAKEKFGLPIREWRDDVWADSTTTACSRCSVRSPASRS